MIGRSSARETQKTTTFSPSGSQLSPRNMNGPSNASKTSTQSVRTLKLAWGARDRSSKIVRTWLGPLNRNARDETTHKHMAYLSRHSGPSSAVPFLSFEAVLRRVEPITENAARICVSSPREFRKNFREMYKEFFLSGQIPKTLFPHHSSSQLKSSPTIL